jgi:hypothetical protein
MSIHDKEQHLMTTADALAQQIIDNQGDDLSRYQRMFLKQDIAAVITQATAEATAALEAERRRRERVEALARAVVDAADVRGWRNSAIDALREALG